MRRYRHHKPSTLKIEEVPKGSARKVELFAYFRSSTSQACAPHKSINELDPGNVASLGSTTVDILNDNQVVDLDISLPAAGATLVIQYNLPAFCTAGSTTLGDGSARILTARASGSTTHFKS